VLVSGACGDINVNQAVDAAGDTVATDTIVAQACQTNGDCDTKIACRVGTCDPVTHTCQVATAPGTCFIEGSGCFNGGQEQPGDRCKICQPALNPTSFVNKQCAAGQTCIAATGECEGSPTDVGNPCKNADDCSSKLCLPTPEGLACSQSCGDGGCPDGFTCQGDGQGGKACVSLWAWLCSPCGVDADCTQGAAEGATCRAAGLEGSFCATPCTTSGDCPDTYTCDATAKLCVPVAGTCSGCSAWAAAQGKSTSCGQGACSGTRTCTTTGLAACNGPSPEPEACDGEDDDCDGDTDEDWKTDGQLVSAEHCGACGSPCAIAHGSAVCELVSGSPACTLVGCDAGYQESPPGVCTPQAAEGCTPCAGDLDCAAPLGCEPIGAGSFCVAACSVGTTVCGAGFVCRDAGGGQAFCLLETGGCASAGSPCTKAADCEDLNLCTTGACPAGSCELAPDDSAAEPCYDGPPETAGEGPCAAGVAACSGGVLGACALQVLPAPDVCGDGVDNDCEGTKDTDCAIVGVDFGEFNARPIGTAAKDGTLLELTVGPTPIGPPPPASAPLKVELGFYPIVYPAP
jgi:hypothetical protein